MLPSNEKILVLTHPECDYGATMLFNGLNEVLGPGRVLPYPDKLSYYGQTHKYSLPNIPNGETSPTPWSLAVPRPYTGRYKDENGDDKRDDHPVYEIRSMLRDGTIRCVLVESLRYKALEAFNELREDINRANAAVIAMDGEDYAEIYWDKVNLVSPKIFLKREMRKEWYDSGDMVINGIRVIGFPFSACTTKIFEVCPDYYPVAVRHDVSFMCGRTASFRQWIADRLREQTDLRVQVAISPDDKGTSQPLFRWSDYINEMHESWIAVSALGFGNDCVRFWEASVIAPLFSQNPNLHMQNPLNPDEHYVEIDQHNMISKIRDWLGRKEDLLALYRRCREHVIGCHSNTARAKRVLELFDEIRA